MIYRFKSAVGIVTLSFYLNSKLERDYHLSVVDYETAKRFLDFWGLLTVTKSLNSGLKIAS